MSYAIERKLSAWKKLYDEWSAVQLRLRDEALDPLDRPAVLKQAADLRKRSDKALKELQALMAEPRDGTL